ncbi:MAG: hypothetical protein HC905_14455 [Bacteroidales bacterium]|nr:hypothetical protein [Bacteroidales bacterium]
MITKPIYTAALCFIFLMNFLAISAQLVKISVFNSLPVKSVIITSYEGDYEVLGDELPVTFLEKGKNLYISLYDGALLLNSLQGSIGKFGKLKFKATSVNQKLRIATVEPKSTSRNISDNLELNVEYGRIILVNETDVENI